MNLLVCVQDQALLLPDFPAAARFVTKAPKARKPVLRPRYKMTLKEALKTVIQAAVQNTKRKKPCGFLLTATLMIKAKTVSARKKDSTLAP